MPGWDSWDTAQSDEQNASFGAWGAAMQDSSGSTFKPQVRLLKRQDKAEGAKERPQTPPALDLKAREERYEKVKQQIFGTKPDKSASSKK